jgi:hypothetical protein
MLLTKNKVTCLNIYRKIALMLEELSIIKGMLADDSIRPQTRCNLEDKSVILHDELRKMYMDLFKIVMN